MASFIAPRSDEWEAMHPWGRAPLKHEIPRLAHSELYRHWFVSNLTCPASTDATFAAMISLRSGRVTRMHPCSPSTRQKGLQMVEEGPANLQMGFLVAVHHR